MAFAEGRLGCQLLERLLRRGIGQSTGSFETQPRQGKGGCKKEEEGWILVRKEDSDTQHLPA
jgi:hypothetical protein